MTWLRATRLVLLFSLASVIPAAAQQVNKPRVPAGAPIAGLTIALFGTGIDYMRADVARRLARDGEGELLGFDAVDNDRAPYAADGDMTALALIGVPLIAPIRVDWNAPATWTAAMAFLDRTPLRIVALSRALPSGTARIDLLARFGASPNVLFLVPADGAYVAASGTAAQAAPANVIVLDALGLASASGGRLVDLFLAPPQALREAPGVADAPPRTAAEAAVMAVGLFACVDMRAARTPADVKALLISKGKRDPKLGAPLLETCRQPAGR